MMPLIRPSTCLMNGICRPLQRKPMSTMENKGPREVEKKMGIRKQRGEGRMTERAILILKSKACPSGAAHTEVKLIKFKLIN